MGDEADDLRVKLKAKAEERVGGDAVTSKYGLDCFGLVDQLLRDLGAATAADGKVPVTATADYDWGDPIMLLSIQPGDILQFHKHLIKIQTFTFANNQWYETETKWLTRPHHTAIVLEVHDDGSVTVAEQNIQPNPKKVTRSVIPRLTGDETKRVNSELKIKTTVTGEVKAYRPAPKPPKGASLLRTGKLAPTIAGVVPSQGGAKRVPGSIGMEVRSPGDDRA